MLGLFRRSGNRQLVEALDAAIVAASRRPSLFTRYGIEDTFEGRFESLTLHAVLVLRRLNALPAPGASVAQDLADDIFRQFERALREMGVGDTTIPKRMKGLAEAFLGRSAAYDEGLRGSDAGLAATLARNIYGGKGTATHLTHYVRAAQAALDLASLDDLLTAPPPFPDPDLVTEDLP